MKNKFFAKSSHTDNFYAALLGHLFISIFLIMLLSETTTAFIISTVIQVAISALLLWFERYNKNAGVYIDGSNIVYKGIRSRKIDVNKIAAIKIIQETKSGGYSGLPVPITKEGKPLFLAILLSGKEELMQDPWKYESNFISEFKEYYIASFAYNKEVVDYLCSLKPDIEIIPHYTTDK